MALPAQKQAQYWGIAATVFLLVMWFLGNTLLPFMIGGAIAYFLDPVADRLEAWGLSRAMATAVITVVAVLIFVIMIILVIPTLIAQTAQLIDALPGLFGQLQTFVNDRFPEAFAEGSALREQIAKLGELLQSKSGQLFNALLGSARGLVNIFVLFLIVPVVAVYMLLDWDKMIARVDDLLPRDHAPTIRRLAGEIDRTLAGFIRGQGTVCLILGAYYAISLMIAGLNYGLVVGFIAGLVSFIPYVGTLVGGGMALGLALFQFWGDWWMIVAIAVIFQLGQILEGNILTPKLVGGSVGLHPVWLLLALSVFGSIFGFAGMMIAVPVAAVIGVVTRFVIAQYREGRLYRGIEGKNAESEAE